ncbi:plp-dependent transferase [Fusarium beomiforme]|uniref:Plp-dependent transferase n=1 Tax=Fusarium beomiforme TaxID=44412 RepID=A0A9P5A9E8_9HYPO|nr:plp-dependent transferase [Fusarium beomiforme]
MVTHGFKLGDIPQPDKVDTPWSHALPPAPRHAITSHFPGWKALVRLAERDPAHLSKVVSIYPRILPHKDCAQSVSIRSFESSLADGSKLYMYAVMFPLEKLLQVMPWWSDTGVAVSSRFAEHVLANVCGLREVPVDTTGLIEQDGAPHRVLRERIAYLVERAPITVRKNKVQPSDVYLFQSGMAAIYNMHQYLQHVAGDSKRKSVMLRVCFYETRHVLNKYGPGLQFFPMGSKMDEIEQFLRDENARGSPVLSVWTECPSNPLLYTPDLPRLRRLSDELGFTLIVDDTVGGFCNVDVLPVADVIVTSLSKLFSGHADVLAGSIVLNPSSRIYNGLKQLINQEYVNDLYIDDARTLRHNSEDYLHRAAIVNKNAKMLTDWLYKRSKIEHSSIKHVYYPTIPHSQAHGNYDVLMRTQTAEFTPGYGCLFSLEFKSQESAIAFYDNLHTYHGPHLGAHRTIALGFTYLIYGHEKELNMSDLGLSVAQIRISVGLEDSETLLNFFKYAVMKADEVQQGQISNGF